MTRPRSSAERLAVLHGVVSELASRVDNTQLFAAVASGVRKLVGAPFAVALAWDGARRELVVEATVMDIPGAGDVSTTELALCAAPAFASRATICLDDLDEHPRAAALARRLGLGSAVALPIPRHGEGPPLGAVCVAVGRDEPSLTIDDVRALELFVSYGGAALSHAESVAAGLRRVARVEQLTMALRGLSEARERALILERGLDCATDVLGADRAVIYLTNSREELSFLVGRGLSRVYLELAAQRYRQSAGGLLHVARVPVYVADVQTDPRTRVLHEIAAQEGLRSILLVPMLRGGRMTGALLLYHDLVWAYDPEDIAHARALADELAVAVANAGVSEATQREITRIRALDRMAHLLLDGAGFRKALQAVVDAGVASSAWLWSPAMTLIAEAGTPEAPIEDIPAVGKIALESGRPTTRTPKWGVVSAIPVRHAGQIVGAVAIADRRKPPVEAAQASLHLTVTDDVDVAEPQALAAGVAHHLGAALGHHFGREAHTRAGGSLL